MANAPVNLAPNSQWDIFSGFSYATRINIEGTGTLGPLSITGNSVGSSDVDLIFSGAIGQVKAGQLIKLDGVGADPALTAAPLRIRSIVGNIIKVRLPLGFIATINHPSSAVPINIGGTQSLNTGDAADGWKKDSNLRARAKRS